MKAPYNCKVIADPYNINFHVIKKLSIDYNKTTGLNLPIIAMITIIAPVIRAPTVTRSTSLTGK